MLFLVVLFFGVAQLVTIRKDNVEHPQDGGSDSKNKLHVAGPGPGSSLVRGRGNNVWEFIR